MPVHNRKDITKRCLDTLYVQTNNNYKIIVVDDGSTDGTSEIVTNHFPDIILLKGDGNLWWTGATNLGISHAIEIGNDNDYVMLLNDDLVVKEDFIETATNITTKHPKTLIQAVEMNANNTDSILNGGWKINWYTAKYFQINSGKQINEFKNTHYEHVSTQTGRGTLIPIHVLKEIGLYNSAHYPQCGDFEFPVRAHNNGYSLIMCYDFKIYSFVEETCDMNTDTKYKLSDIFSYFGNIRSYAYFPSRFWFAYDTASNPLKGFLFFLFDLTRVTTHFIKNLQLLERFSLNKSIK